MPQEKKPFSFEIIETIGVISLGSNGWKKELNLVSWNGNKPKYDIRDWDDTHEHMSKGITLNGADLLELKKLLDGTSTILE